MASVERALMRRQFQSSQQEGLASYNAAKQQVLRGNAFTAPVYPREG